MRQNVRQTITQEIILDVKDLGRLKRDGIIVTLPSGDTVQLKYERNGDRKGTGSKKEGQIIEAMGKGATKSLEIAKNTGLLKGAVLFHLKRMNRDNIVKKIGSNHQTRWILANGHARKAANAR